MENCCPESHASMEIALKEAGFVVEKTVKQGKKTVITVIQELSQGQEGQREEKRLDRK